MILSPIDGERKRVGLASALIPYMKCVCILYRTPVKMRHPTVDPTHLPVSPTKQKHFPPPYLSMCHVACLAFVVKSEQIHTWL